ncbi:ABC-ATPase domain-containing protein [Bacillus kexueae]|uniref:ABC-ATPase domain-containing protein n=1 Tax=Aeribacillus kexueae TaxID=2078952 RepID=UPI001FAF430A
MESLKKKLESIDGRGYKAYQQIKGTYSFPLYSIVIDSVQGDPYASPSKVRVLIKREQTQIPESLTRMQKIRCEDAILRTVYKQIEQHKGKRKGNGKSGLITIDHPTQKILERTAISMDDQWVTICLHISLPAKGRTILGKEAIDIFYNRIPSIVKQSILSLSKHQYEDAIILGEQQLAIRKFMKERDIIAFIANGSILPRESGVSDRPLHTSVTSFRSPDSLQISIPIPYSENPIKGMAIPKGITVIVGGGYHGKSTLLKAIENGVYNHIKGDGREFVLTDETACKIRAEDGRSVVGVDISPFIQGLPNEQSTTHFTTENASGSTSQAANIMEMLEIGSNVLLIDEDTSATNFMIRDARMQALIHKTSEPITPLIDKITQLKNELDVSTILVMGGSGDYFHVADHVIKLDHYKVYDVTKEAKEIIEQEAIRLHEGGDSFGSVTSRYIQPQTFTANSRLKIKTRGVNNIQLGYEDVSLLDVEQLVDESQTRMISTLFEYFSRHEIEHLSLKDILNKIERTIEEKGLSYFSSFKGHPGYLARPRIFEIAAALNRIRSLKVRK